jgi:uncharacterized phage infection (PIP) family protein YhgE
MSNIEGAPNIGNPELNSSGVEVDNDAGSKPEEEHAPEKLEKIATGENQEQEVEKPALSPDEQLKTLEGEVETTQQEISNLNETIEGTRTKINEVREQLGLRPNNEDSPSISSEKDKLEQLKAEQEGLDIQKEQLISQRERDQLIREEKLVVLQDKLDEVFKEFENLNPRVFDSIIMIGKTPEGHNLESRSLGFLDPEVAQNLAKAFKEGVKLLPKILESLPDLLKKFDDDLTNEAADRVDKILTEEKQKSTDEQNMKDAPEVKKPKEELGTPDDEISPSGFKTEIVPAVESDTEAPKT